MQLIDLLFSRGIEVRAEGFDVLHDAVHYFAATACSEMEDG